MKKKILGIKPFNEIYFRSCYYHQLLAGVSAFNVNKDEVLLSFYTLIKENYSLCELNLNEYQKFKSKRGFKIKECNLNKEKLINWINKGNPVILGVDDYYLESKKETYLKLHEPHFILAYGYDLEKDLVNVIEHDYRNDYNYHEKEISLTNLLMANHYFKAISIKRKTCRVIIKKKRKKEINYFDFIKPKFLKANQVNAFKNLVKLRMMLLNSPNEIIKLADQLSNYLGKVKEGYHILTSTNLFKNDEKLISIINKLIIAYQTTQSVIWKVNYVKDTDFIEKNMHKILSNVDMMIKLEKEVYNHLLEVCRNAKKY